MSTDGVINVKADPFFAVGDGVTDDTGAIQRAIDACCGSASAPHGINYHLNKQLYFPPGHYRAENLLFTKLQGVRVLGAGRFVTTIESLHPGVPVIRTNGAGYCHFEALHLKASGAAAVFDLNWDGTAGGAALQSNTFTDMFFEGGVFGVQIGASGFMGSENLFLNCFWILNATAGLMVSASNALQQSVIGGNFQGCGHGILVGSGSVPIIHGVGFQQQSGYDIRVDNSTSSNAMSIQGCRTESRNFYYGGVPVSIVACAQSGASPTGEFAVLMGNNSVISACYSQFGRISPRYWAQMRIESCTFNRRDWFQPEELWWIPQNNLAACIEIENAWGGGEHIRRRRVVANPAGGTRSYISHEYLVDAGVAHT